MTTLAQTPPLYTRYRSLSPQVPVYLFSPLFASRGLQWLALGIAELDLLAQNNDVTEANTLCQQIEARYLKSGNSQPFCVFLALNGYATFFPAASRLLGLEVSQSDASQGHFTGNFCWTRCLSCRLSSSNEHIESNHKYGKSVATRSSFAEPQVYGSSVGAFISVLGPCWTGGYAF
jgi:hypothetical protein